MIINQNKCSVKGSDLKKLARGELGHLPVELSNHEDDFALDLDIV